MNQPTLNPDAIRIDCRGVRIATPVLTIDRNGKCWQFIMNDELRRTTACHAGLFTNLQVNSEDALQYPNDQRFCALLESPINVCYSHLSLLQERFGTIFTHQQTLLDQGSPYMPLMFGTNWMNVWSDADSHQVQKRHPDKTKHISFMGSIQHNNSGAYSFRREVAEFAIQHGDIDCFGKGIKEIPGKEAALANYRFSIAMENASSDFYFSEKLIDCLLMETVPIYYGCPGITELLDPRGLLTFSNLAELQSLLQKATEETYQQMRPFVLANKKKVIAENWHSHLGLFNRLIDRLPNDLNRKPPVLLKQPSVAHRIKDRLVKILMRIRE